MEEVIKKLKELRDNTACDENSQGHCGCEKFDEIIDMIENKSMEKNTKRLHHIDTFASGDNEVYLSGKDEHGKDFAIVFEAHEFLSWIDTDYIKERLIEDYRNE